MSRFVILILLFTQTFAFSQECMKTVEELFKSGGVSEEKMQDFLNIQASITMHKLAYAFLQKADKNSFKVEDEILKLLEKRDQKSDSDEKFKLAYEQFKGNKLSRKALGDILPYVVDILDEQSHEESSFRREKFNINMSDIKLLAILGEKEKARNGKLDHRLFKSHSSDNSILNFAKIINSSIRNTTGSKENILERMSLKIEEMNNKALSLIKEINHDCYEEVLSCSVNDKESVILPSATTESFIDIIGSLKTDPHKHLRYGDVWLYTGKKRSDYSYDGRRINRNYKGKRGVHRYSLLNLGGKDYENLVLNELADKVLRAVPQLFTREELLKDKEFTLALAQGIDRGVVTAKRPHRYIIYKGEKYLFPETISGLDLRTDLEKKAAQATSDYIYAQMGMNKDSLRTIGDLPKNQLKALSKIDDFPKGVSKNEVKAFLKARQNQYEKNGNKYSFQFKGKLYLLETGEEIKKSKDFFLKKFKTGKKAYRKTLNPFDLKGEERKNFIKQVNLKNRSLIHENEVYLLSGEKANLEAEYRKAKIYYNSASKNNNNTESLRSLKDIKESINKEGSEFKALYIKAITDRERAFVYNDQVILARTGRTVSKKKIESISWLNEDKSLKATQLAAALNSEATFYSGDKEYETKTAKAVEQMRSIAGSKSHDLSVQYENRINKLDDESKIIEFHKGDIGSCKSYTIVDKKNSILRVYANSGEILLETEILSGSKTADAKTKYLVYEDNKRETNNSTEAGIFEFSSLGRSSKSGERFVGIEGSIGGISAVSRSNPHRYSLFNDGDLSNNRETGGGIVMRPHTFKRFQNYVKKGCPYYVLPEEKKNSFFVSEGELHYNKRKTRSKVKDITIKIDPSFKVNKLTEKYISALESEKRTIMSDLNISDSEYNELAKIAIGVLGVESKFGNTDLFEGKGVNRYGLKNSWLGGLIVWSGKALKRGEFDFDGSERSRGLTQIKHVEDYMKGTNYSHIDKKKVKDPKYAAIATMYVLAEKLKQLKSYKKQNSAITNDNQSDYLYYLYMGQGKQLKNATATPDFNPKVRAVNEIANKVLIYTED